MARRSYRAYLAFGLVILVLSSIAVARYLTYNPFPPEHAMLYDQSLSKIDGCSCMKSYARRLAENATTPNERVTLYALGTTSDGYQPKFKKTFQIPKDNSVLGDKGKAQAEIEAFVNAIETECNAIPRSSRTPLIQGVKTLLEQLQSNRSPGARRSLFVQSDLEEDVSPELLEAFKMEKSGKPIANIQQLNNDGIPVTFAGTSEIVVGASQPKKRSSKDRGLQKLSDGDIWKKLWARSFKQSDVVKFEPICNR